MLAHLDDHDDHDDDDDDDQLYYVRALVSETRRNAVIQERHSRLGTIAGKHMELTYQIVSCPKVIRLCIM